MRPLIFGLSAAFLISFASPVLAQEASPGDITVSGGGTLVTDYRFRGISQSNRRPAIQGTFTASHASGLYGTVWGSSVDDYIADNSAEIDFVAGYKTTTSGGTTLDAGVTYYYYPDSTFQNSDFAEFYGSVSHTLGPVAGKVAAFYAPKQRALSVTGPKEDNLYVSGD